MKAFSILLFPALLFGETQLLKNTKQELLDNSRKEAKLTGELLKHSWWGNVKLEGSYNWSEFKGESDNFPNFTVSISQDIFRSGGIYWQIKKGKAFQSLNSAVLDKTERDMIFTLYSLVLNIQKLDIGIKKQKLSITNQNILIRNQKDSYLNGILDISILDESIIQLNSLKNSEEGIVQNRIDLIANLKDITDLDYTHIQTPKNNIFAVEKFLSQNIELNIQKQEIENKRLDKNIAYSNYLPKVSIYGNYQYEDSDNFPVDSKDSHRYGIKMTIPIGFNMGDAFETAQIMYLKSQSELNDKIENQKNIYRRILSKLESIDRRVQNSKELIESYQSIYEVTKDYYESDLKTIDDVTILENRVNISKFDLEIYKIDKDITKLSLYQGILEK